MSNEPTISADDLHVSDLGDLHVSDLGDLHVSDWGAWRPSDLDAPEIDPEQEADAAEQFIASLREYGIIE